MADGGDQLVVMVIITVAKGGDMNSSVERVKQLSLFRLDQFSNIG